MALADVLTGISTVVAALTPTAVPGSPFMPLLADEFASLPDVAMMRPRTFEVIAEGGPFDGDNISAADLGYQSQSVSISVGYPVGMVRGRGPMASLIAQDMAAIYDAIRNPANWSGITSLLELTPDSETRVDEITGESGIAGYVATVTAVAEWSV